MPDDTTHTSDQEASGIEDVVAAAVEKALEEKDKIPIGVRRFQRWLGDAYAWTKWRVTKNPLLTAMSGGLLVLVFSTAGYIVEEVLPRWGVPPEAQPYYTQGQGQALSLKVDDVLAMSCELTRKTGGTPPASCPPPPEPE